MLLLYRTLLIVFVIAIAISYSQGARYRSENVYRYAFTGIAIFVLSLVIVGISVNSLTGTSAIESIASTLAVTCIPLFIALYARVKLLPDSPLFSLPRSVPIVPVTVVTVCLTLFLIANELNGTILAGIVESLTGPSAGGRASQLEFNATLANAKGTLVISAIVGWLLIAAYIYQRLQSKKQGYKP